MKREYNYDLLRVICMLAVIVLHVSAVYMDNSSIKGGVDDYCVLLCNTITRFAVPCFLMMSGAFLLSGRITDSLLFYKKAFNKLGIPIIIFSLIYTIYNILKMLVHGMGVRNAILEPLALLVTGKPFPHMWYMFMLIGVYFFIPVASMIKKNCSDKSFFVISFVFLLFGVISGWTRGDDVFAWGLGSSIEYFGYVMVGAVVHDWARRKTRNKPLCCLLLIVGVGFFVLLTTWLYYCGTMSEAYWFGLSVISYFSPCVVLGSVCIFASFSLMSIRNNKKLQKISINSFYIYLIHRGILDLIHFLCLRFIGEEYTSVTKGVWFILFVSLLVLIVSLLLSLAFSRMNNSIVNRIGFRIISKEGHG